MVFSGGEPTAQPGVGRAMREAKAMGCRIGLHSADIYPRRFEEVLPWVDSVGFDAKAPFDVSFQRITGVRCYAPQEFRDIGCPSFRARGCATAADLDALSKRFAQFGVRPG